MLSVWLYIIHLSPLHGHAGMETSINLFFLFGFVAELQAWFWLHCKPQAKSSAVYVCSSLLEQKEDLRKRLSFTTHKLELLQSEFDSTRQYLETELRRAQEELDKFTDKLRRWCERQRLYHRWADVAKVFTFCTWVQDKHGANVFKEGLKMFFEFIGTMHLLIIS